MTKFLRILTGAVIAAAAALIGNPAQAADSYTTNCRIVQMVPGSNDSTWGTKANAAFAMLDECATKVTSISITAGNVTLSTANNATDQSRSAVLVFTGTPGTTRTVTAPNVQKIFHVVNTSDSAITFGAGGGTTVTVATLTSEVIYTDGSTNAARANTAVYLNNAGLRIADTNASHALSLVPGSNLTADRVLTITTGDAARTLDLSTASLDMATVVTLTGAQALTNKTFAIGSNTLSGTTAQFNTALSDGDFTTLAGSEVLTNKSLTSPTLTGTVTLPGSTATIATDGIGLGAAAGSPFGINILRSSNSIAGMKIVNSSNGNAAHGGYFIENDNASADANLTVLGSGFSTVGSRAAGSTVLNADGTGLVLRAEDAGATIKYDIVNALIGGWNETGLGVGALAVTNPLEVSKSTNGEAAIKMGNANGGAAAYAKVFVDNGTSSGGILQFGASFTTSGVLRQNGTALQAGGAGGLTLYTSANQPVYVAVNSTEVAEFTSSTLLLAATAGLTNSGKTILSVEALAPGNNLVLGGTAAQITNTAGTITGVAGGVAGRVIILIGRNNLGSTNTISNESGSSTAANRFDLPGGTDIVLSDDGTATFIYNGDTSRWNLIGFSG